MGDCEGGLRGTLPAKQVGGEERGEGEELSPAEGVGEGVWTKRKRVFGCFRMGNIRATSDPSHRARALCPGTGLKWLVYYPFGNTRTPFSSSSFSST